MTETPKVDPFWVRWRPKDALDGMAPLSPLEELAYRRILDLIFTSNDRLLDDDRALAWMTKTLRSWAKVKARLIELGKIMVEGGYIRNQRATEACIESRSFIAQKSAAGQCSAEKRKALRNKQTTPTDVATPDDTDVGTDEPTNYNYNKIQTSSDAGASEQAELLSDEGADPGKLLFTEGLGILARLTAYPLPENERKVRNLMGRLRGEAGGDDVLLLAILRDAGERPPRDAVPWLKAQIKAKHKSGPRLALDNDPNDPWGIQAWCATLPGVVPATDPDDVPIGKWIWRGVIIDSAARRACSAARLSVTWRGSLDAMAAWIEAGLKSSAIADTLASCAGRDSYDPKQIRSLAFFDAAVRERRRAA